jgi:uncharacterized protein
MMKTTVYLPPELKRALRRVAGQRGCGEAELLREAVSRLTGEAKAPVPRCRCSVQPDHRLPRTSTAHWKASASGDCAGHWRGLYAALDANEALHGRTVAALVASKPPRLISPFVLAELDYLIGSRVGHQSQTALIDEIRRGAYQLELFSSEDLGHAKRIMERYADLRIGLADASVVVLANRHRTFDLLCTDERHFRALRGQGGKPSRLLPFDT